MAMAYMPKDFVSNTGDKNAYVALCIALCAYASCNVMKKITWKNISIYGKEYGTRVTQ